jgi:hypothetical protein
MGKESGIDMGQKFRRITYADRLKIAEQLTLGTSRYDIAALVGVAPPTIYRELRSGISGARDAAGRLIYSPDYAEDAAGRNRQLSARKPRPIVGAETEPAWQERGGEPHSETAARQGKEVDHNGITEWDG